MSDPVHHHYLPKEAHLRFFEDPRRPDFIWMYQRDAEPLQVNVVKAARERHIYSFPDEEGKLSAELERQLAQLEDAVLPLLRRLIDSPGDVVMTAEEEYGLANFAAFQAVRTPAQRRTAQEMIGEIGRMTAIGRAIDRDAWRHHLAKLKRDGVAPPDADADEIRDFILDGEYDIVANEQYAMLLSLGLADDLVWTFHSKRLFVLRATGDDPFVTSDHPVMRFANLDFHGEQLR